MFIQNIKKKIMKLIDIIFIFALAFICVVLPVFVKGATIVGSDSGTDNVSNLIIWNTKGYLITLIIIVIFFSTILIHSTKSYKLE